MSEDRIWKVAQSVGFDDYELRPMLEAFAAALSQQPAVPVVSDEQIIRAAVSAMPSTNPLVAEDLIGGHTMHTEAEDIVAIWKAGVQWQALHTATQPCGHPASLIIRSAESGEALYCEACDDKSGRRDAEMREAELREANQKLRDEILALRPAVEPMTWPKGRDVGRYGDMRPGQHLRVGLDSDNDVYVSVWDEVGGASVEFCNPGGGGGGSSRRTREALIALMVAIEADNAERPDKDWWARRNGITAKAEGGA